MYSKKRALLFFMIFSILQAQEQRQILITPNGSAWFDVKRAVSAVDLKKELDLNHYQLPISPRSAWVSLSDGVAAIRTEQSAQIFGNVLQPGSIIKVRLIDGTIFRDVTLEKISGSALHIRKEGELWSINTNQISAIQSKELIPAQRLILKTLSQPKKNRDIQLSYGFQTGLFSWKMDYDLFWNDDEKATLAPSCRISYNGGEALPETKVVLLAGEVNEVRNERPMMRSEGVMMAAKSADYAAPQPEAIADFYRFTLPDLVAFAPRSETRYPVMQASSIAPEKSYLVSGSERSAQIGAAQLIVKILNEKSKGIGEVLPAGTIRSFTAERLFIGSAAIPATPVGESFEFSPGKAFDLTYERKALRYDRSRTGENYTIQYTLRNGSKKNQTFRIEDRFWGEWDIPKSSVSWNRKTADIAEFNIAVPPGKETVLTFDVIKRYK
ncbi:MAG TPA: hypothetical protein ENN84_02245 [Candidatus Marinimicrobia bacterium]|nr:hypothetical protein [Candidatus Neomarinimicrobiota bacterium]